MAACIEEFIMERRGKAFDTIDDEITLGIILNQHKKRINAAVGTFIEEKTRMEQSWQQTINSRNNFTKAINKPSTVHGIRFPHGTSALEKIITLLQKEAKYLPSFGSLKPHIKDHKMKRDIAEVIKEAEETGRTPNIPLRLTHKATTGPTSGIAEITGAVLESLASCCKLALTQASEDVAEFFARIKFRSKPAMGAVDVTDAFWAMSKKICLRRVRKLAERYPQVLDAYGITCNALVAAINLIWDDNFFVAMGKNGPIHGRINGCTMGNVISMALCRIYYFCSLEEAINLVGKEKFIYAKSGGDDALIVARDEQVSTR